MRRWTWTVVVALMTVVACSSDDPSSPGTSTVVGGGGGVVAKDGASLTIPAGALASDVPVAVGRLDAAAVAALPPATAPGIKGTAVLSGDVFAFTPHGTTFAAPVTVELAHAGAGNMVLRLDDERDTTWEVVPGTTFAGGVVRFQVTRFSIYGVATGESDGGPGAPCASTFDCATTTAECGTVIDDCGASHDVVAECPAKAGCGKKGTCTADNTCGACTPYATCAEGLEAEGKDGVCFPSLPNGCGGTMDCATGICPEGQTCVDVQGTFECGVGCTNADTCPQGQTSCTGPNSWEGSFAACVEGVCRLAGTSGDCTDGQGNLTACVEGVCQQTD